MQQNERRISKVRGHPTGVDDCWNKLYWLVVDLPFWKIWVRQWEAWKPIYEMEIKKNVWNHQPGTASEFLKKNRLNKKTKLSFLDILTCIDDHWWWFTALTFLSPKTQLQNPSTSSWTKKQQFPASKNNLISQLVISLKYPPNQIHDRYASEKSQSDQPLINTVMAPISPLKVDGSESWVAPSMSKKKWGIDGSTPFKTGQLSHLCP